MIALRAWREPDEDASNEVSVTTSTVNSASTSLGATSAPVAPPAPLTIGVLSAQGGAIETGVQAEVAFLHADAATFPAGVFAVVQPLTNPEETVTQLLGQGVSALVSDPSGPMVEEVVAASEAAGLPLCLVGDSSEIAAVSGRGIAIGDPRTCTQLFALATVSAGSTMPAPLVDAISFVVGGAGLGCASISQCAAYLDANQPISFEPEGGQIRLAPEAESDDT
jgi:hypothetical protein